MSQEDSFDPIAYLNEPRWREMSLGLDRMRRLLSLLGDPQDRFPSVHVAGTNGKGSTCAFLSSILSASGLKVGMFTSPYIVEFEERIQVDGKNIPSQALCSMTMRVKAAAEVVERKLGEHPTEFELMFAVACLHFADSACDICVIECGLGGRLDATNVLLPILCVVTPIAMDHTDILGETLMEIAGEKAGIVKPGISVVSSWQEQDARKVLLKACEREGSDIAFIDPSEIDEGSVDMQTMERRFTFQGDRYGTSLLAAYQPDNAALAIEASRMVAKALDLSITEDDIRKGIRNAIWPGRFEVVCRDPIVIIDGSHNPHGARSLVSSLGSMGVREGTVSFAMGMLADKDHAGVLDAIAPMASSIMTFSPPVPRALDAGILMEEAASLGIDAVSTSSPREALEIAIGKRRPDGIVVAIGSLYSIGCFKRALDGIC